MSTSFAHTTSADGAPIEMIDVVFALYDLLQHDAGTAGVVQNGLLPGEYVEQLRQRLALTVSLEVVSGAFTALRQLELRGNARDLYGTGMAVSPRRIIVGSEGARELREIDRLERELRDVLEENQSLTDEVERCAAQLATHRSIHGSEEILQE